MYLYIIIYIYIFYILYIYIYIFSVPIFLSIYIYGDTYIYILSNLPSWKTNFYLFGSWTVVMAHNPSSSENRNNWNGKTLAEEILSPSWCQNISETPGPPSYAPINGNFSQDLYEHPHFVSCPLFLWFTMKSLSLFRFPPFVAFFLVKKHTGEAGTQLWGHLLQGPQGSVAVPQPVGLRGVPICGRGACIIPELVYNCWNMMIIKNQFYRLCDDFSILQRQCIPLLLVPQDARHLLTDWRSPRWAVWADRHAISQYSARRLQDDYSARVFLYQIYHFDHLTEHAHTHFISIVSIHEGNKETTRQPAHNVYAHPV